MKKGNVLAVLLATVGIMLFGTLAVSADAHAGIRIRKDQCANRDCRE